MRDGDKVRDHILKAIGAGDFRPGDRLPTERHLCDALSVGRSALRDALAVLESEGWVRRKPGSGTYVAQPSQGPRPGQISPADVMAARLAIEPPLAHLVASHATAADFALMDQCLAEGAAARDLPSFEHWDGALHTAIVQAAHNPLLDAAYALFTAARQQDDWGALKRRSLTPERRLAYQTDHAQIVSALQLRDGVAAEAALRAHLIRVRGNLLDP